MKYLLTVILLMISLITPIAFAIPPQGFNTIMANNKFQYSIDVNGNGFFELSTHPTNTLRTAMAGSAVAIYFIDGSNAILDAQTQKVTVVGKLEGNGTRIRNTYSYIAIEQAWAYWRISAENRVVFNEFVKMSMEIATNGSIVRTLHSANPLFSFDHNENFDSIAPSSFQPCEQQKVMSVHGYLGHKTLWSCQERELKNTSLDAVVMLGTCATTGPVACGLSMIPYLKSSVELINRTYSCESAKDAADQALTQCFINADNYGGGGLDRTGNPILAPRNPTPVLRCAEWIMLKNTTAGDFEFCARWESIP